MNQRASHIGDLAVKILAEGSEGKVTRVFQRSAYVRSGDDFVLLLWGGLRSPMTINIEQDPGKDRAFAVGERCALSRKGIRSGPKFIDVKGAAVHRSALLRGRRVSLPPASELAKGVAMLRSLYGVSKSSPLLPSDSALVTFAKRTLSPLSSGSFDAVYDPDSYLPLIGRGGGFTPAGDDFVGGFVAAFNYLARCRRSKMISLPKDMLFSRTIPESAAILSYALRGYVDEGLEILVIRTLAGDKGFSDELLGVARRGHTSGIDMSLGVILGETAMSDAENRGGALRRCLGVLWKP